MLFQVLYKILKSEKVSERNKQRIKLKDFGYLGLVCFLEDMPVSMITVRCLYEQVLATGKTKVLFISFRAFGQITKVEVLIWCWST